jgi:hypothetical protein
MTRKEIEDFLDNIKSYNPALRKENQWIPTRDAFRQLCQLALKGLDAQGYVPQQSLLEAAKTAREVMRGKDLEHVWTNYPTEPAVTLGQMLDAAIRKCEPERS